MNATVGRCVKKSRRLLGEELDSGVYYETDVHLGVGIETDCSWLFEKSSRSRDPRVLAAARLVRTNFR
jgi:hypothetical protein